MQRFAAARRARALHWLCAATFVASSALAFRPEGRRRPLARPHADPLAAIAPDWAGRDYELLVTSARAEPELLERILKRLPSDQARADLKAKLQADRANKNLERACAAERSLLLLLALMGQGEDFVRESSAENLRCPPGPELEVVRGDARRALGQLELARSAWTAAIPGLAEGRRGPVFRRLRQTALELGDLTGAREAQLELERYQGSEASPELLNGLLDLGLLEAARAEEERLTQLPRPGERTHRRLTKLRIQLHERLAELERALEILRHEAPQHSGDLELTKKELFLLKGLGRTEERSSLLKQLAARGNPAPELLLEWAQAEDELGRREQAATILTRATRLDLSRRDLERALDLAEQLGMPELGKALVERAIASGGSPEELFVQGEHLLARGERARALALWSKAVEMAPNQGAALSRHGDLLLSAGAISDALTAHEAAVALAPHDAPKLRGLALACERAAAEPHRKDAIERLRQAGEIWLHLYQKEQHTDEALSHLLWVWQRRGVLGEELRKRWNKRSRKAPLQADDWLLVQLLEHEGKRNEAEFLLKEWHAQNPADLRVAERLLALWAKRGKWPSVREHQSWLTNFAGPARVALYRTFLEQARAQKDTQETADWMARLLAESPTDPSLLIDAATVFERAGRWSAAQEALKRAFQTTRNARAAFTLGEFLLRRGDTPGALRAYEDALSAPGTEDDAQRSSTTLRSLLRDAPPEERLLGLDHVLQTLTKVRSRSQLGSGLDEELLSGFAELTSLRLPAELALRQRTILQARATALWPIVRQRSGARALRAARLVAPYAPPEARSALLALCATQAGSPDTDALLSELARTAGAPEAPLWLDLLDAPERWSREAILEAAQTLARIAPETLFERPRLAPTAESRAISYFVWSTTSQGRARLLARLRESPEKLELSEWERAALWAALEEGLGQAPNVERAALLGPLGEWQERDLPLAGPLLRSVLKRLEAAEGRDAELEEGRCPGSADAFELLDARIRSGRPCPWSSGTQLGGSLGT